MKQNDVIVIGGGAAGMIAAWRAAAHGADVVLLEKNKKLGIKILISGGGKCNITNGSDIQSMLKQFQTNESRFLKYSFHVFTNTQLLEIFHQQGVETYTRENGKVFPKSHNADDVVTALLKLLDGTGVIIHFNSAVTDIARCTDGSFQIKTTFDEFFAKKVIIATGGSSYQKTGTTGDGFSWAEKLGHTIIPIRPALAPIYLEPTPPSLWQGTPIRECSLMAICGNQIIAEWHGDMLFTHLGISGPASLEISKNAFVEFALGKLVTIHVDFYPEYSPDELEEKLLGEVALNVNRSVINFTEQLVPQRLAEYTLLQANIDGNKKLHQLKKEERKSLSSTLKRCFLGAVKEIPLDRGEVTAGGIALHEVDPTSMESKLVKGLFLCGEILDIAGPVGGYNLQAAFSTGYVAGENAAQQ
jgi:predicted Rossmann fold flavoprotein